jgi:hypothetical protein
VSKVYEVWLTSRNAADLVVSNRVAIVHHSKPRAMQIARRAAGDGVRFVGVQGRCEYRGSNGTASIA